MGAPGYSTADGTHSQGCVFVVEDLDAAVAVAEGQEDNAVEVEDVADWIICDERAEDPYSRFGHSVAAVDVDGDGLEDLIIGAPNSGEHVALAIIHLSIIITPKHGSYIRFFSLHLLGPGLRLLPRLGRRLLHLHAGRDHRA